jgi:hypothetical protein
MINIDFEAMDLERIQILRDVSSSIIGIDKANEKLLNLYPVIKCDQLKGSGEDVTRVFLVKCSKCNEEVEGDSNYCGNCGSKWNNNKAYFSF